MLKGVQGYAIQFSPSQGAFLKQLENFGLLPMHSTPNALYLFSPRMEITLEFLTIPTVFPILTG